MVERYCNLCGTRFVSSLDTSTRMFCSQGCRVKARDLTILKTRIKKEGYDGFRVKDLKKCGYKVEITPISTVEV